MNKLSLFFLLSVSLFIGIADFVTTSYGLSIGLIEADGLYIPFLSTLVFIGIGLFADYLSHHLNYKDEKEIKFYNYFSVFSLSLLAGSMIIPIINNLSLII